MVRAHDKHVASDIETIVPRAQRPDVMDFHISTPSPGGSVGRWHRHSAYLARGPANLLQRVGLLIISNEPALVKLFDLRWAWGLSPVLEK